MTLLLQLTTKTRMSSIVSKPITVVVDAFIHVDNVVVVVFIVVVIFIVVVGFVVVLGVIFVAVVIIVCPKLNSKFIQNWVSNR